MMLKTGMEVAQYYNVFNYGTPIPQKQLKPQYIKTVSGSWVKTAPTFILPGNSKEKFGK